MPNLCGYHASYNLLENVLCAKYGIQNQIHNSAAFWSYVSRTQAFLATYALRTRKDRKAWPWTDKDIKDGDFERTYWNVCVSDNDFVKNSLASEAIDGIKYNILMATVYYQYDNLVFNMNERQQLDQIVE